MPGACSLARSAVTRCVFNPVKGTRPMSTPLESDPFDVPDDGRPSRRLTVSAAMAEAALSIRCEDCNGCLFECADHAVLELEYLPGVFFRLWGGCEARRDVLGIPFNMPGPPSRELLARLLNEPREMG